jgi:2-dehydropantoate 2-reductase
LTPGEQSGREELDKDVLVSDEGSPRAYKKVQHMATESMIPETEPRALPHQDDPSAELLVGRRGYRYLLLTTYRRSGEPVSTPVWFVEEEGRLYITTAKESGKVKRLRHTTRVLVAPCAPWGAVRGPAVHAVARLLPAADHARAHAALRRKYGWQLRLLEGLRRGGEHTYVELSAVPVALSTGFAAHRNQRRQAMPAQTLDEKVHKSLAQKTDCDGWRLARLEPPSKEDDRIKKMLIYGAGPLGSLFAARLHQAGEDVSILARGQRLKDLREHGVILENAFSGAREVARVKVVESLEPEDTYDLIMVVMRKARCLEILPTLAKNRHAHTVLFLQNNPTGFDEYVAALGAKRVMVGFPSAGGERRDPVMRVVPLDMAPIPIGEINGSITDRTRQVAALLKRTGKPAEIRRDMDAWLVSHIPFLLTYFGMFAADLDLARYTRTRDAILLGVRACAEALRAQKAAGIPIRPAVFYALAWMPEPLTIFLLRVGASTKAGEFGSEELRGAGRREDLARLIEEYRGRVDPGGMATPTVGRIAAHVVRAVPPLPDGSSEVPMDWRGVWILAAAKLALVSLAVLLIRRRSR